MQVNKVWIVNLWGKAFSGFSKGELNKLFCSQAQEFFAGKGCEIQTTNISEDYSVDDEIAKYQWCDLIFYQSPTNWMGMPWEAKKWADEIWTAGMDGRLCAGDGRHRESPEDGYGTGGSLKGKHYMLSLTLNAPKGAFGRSSEFLFAGKQVDDLWFPFHANNKFMGLEQIPESTFATFDVLKNPKIDVDKKRFQEHLGKLF